MLCPLTPPAKYWSTPVLPVLPAHSKRCSWENCCQRPRDGNEPEFSVTTTPSNMWPAYKMFVKRFCEVPTAVWLFTTSVNRANKQPLWSSQIKRNRHVLLQKSPERLQYRTANFSFGWAETGLPTLEIIYTRSRSYSNSPPALVSANELFENKCYKNSKSGPVVNELKCKGRGDPVLGCWSQCFLQEYSKKSASQAEAVNNCKK